MSTLLSFSADFICDWVAAQPAISIHKAANTVKKLFPVMRITPIAEGYYCTPMKIISSSLPLMAGRIPGYFMSNTGVEINFPFL